MENLAGNTRKKSFHKVNTPRNDAIPAVKANGMENKDTYEGTSTDGT
jgi:hypothetical protein